MKEGQRGKRAEPYLLISVFSLGAGASSPLGAGGSAGSLGGGGRPGPVSLGVIPGGGGPAAAVPALPGGGRP